MGRDMLNINQHLDSNLFRSEVRAICDTNAERLHENQKEFKVDFATADYREAINRDDIDIVGIFSPDHLHMEMIEEAFKAGKHIICTKPMVTNLAQAMKTVELVKHYNRKFLVGQTRRYVRHHIEAKALYDSGKIGTPLLCEASYVHGDIWNVFDRGAWRYTVPQNVIYGGMCHPIDHLRWYFGDIDEVSAYGAPSPIDERYPQDYYLNIIANLKFKSGLIGRVLNANGIVSPAYGELSDVFPCEGVSIFGTKGSITNFHARYYENGIRGDAVTVDFNTSENANDFDGIAYQGHQVSVLRYVKEMEDCIIEDKKPLIDEISGAKVIATCSAIEESIKTGKPVKVMNEF